MSENVNSNRRSSRRKPLKTTRILAEIDDETSGTEGFYVSDGTGGLCDTLLCEYESRDPEPSSVSPSLIGDVTDEDKTDCNVVPTTTVISSSSSEDVIVSGSNQTCSRRGQPQQSRTNVDDGTSPLLPIDEYNVGPVLEKLLAMMQSMSMLLSALKNDLRHSNMPEVLAKKRDAATTQLWRAFVAYQKSFSEIEQFACSSKTCQQAAKKTPAEPVRSVSQSHVKPAVLARSSRRSKCLAARETDVIEVSESESDEDVESKRPRYDRDETVELSMPPPVTVSSATEELTDNTLLTTASSDAAASSYAPSTSESNTSCDISDTSAS